jgi:hypothetical protein
MECVLKTRVMWKNVLTSAMSCGFNRIDINSGHLLTHPQTTNIYESVKNSLKKTLISEVMAGGLPTFQAAVPTPISAGRRRFLPHVLSLKLYPHDPAASSESLYSTTIHLLSV